LKPVIISGTSRSCGVWRLPRPMLDVHILVPMENAALISL